jgi:hypothetical protein
VSDHDDDGKFFIALLVGIVIAVGIVIYMATAGDREERRQLEAMNGQERTECEAGRAHRLGGSGENSDTIVGCWNPYTKVLTVTRKAQELGIRCELAK